MTIAQPLPSNPHCLHAMRYFPQMLVIELISEQYSSTCEQELVAQMPNLAYR